MGRPGYIFDQFRETARCRDAQHGGGVCCAFAPQLVIIITFNILLYFISVCTLCMLLIILILPGNINKTCRRGELE